MKIAGLFCLLSFYFSDIFSKFATLIFIFIFFKIMLKYWLRISVVLFALFASLSLSSQEYRRVLLESFENGIPADWTQEKVVGDCNWVEENANFGFPNTIFDGKKRLVFRNNTNVTTKSKTRLVLPSMDLSNLYQPILVFAHAQDAWMGDFDTLKILYRNSPDSRWVELKVFDKVISNWQVDTVRLIGVSHNYQIAFEATDNLGRGIVIDNVEIRTTPNCVVPYSLYVSNLSTESATINWLGAFDAESFVMKVSSVPLSVEQLNSDTLVADVVDTLLADVWDFNLDGLNVNSEYYCYLRSNCYGESSDWSEEFVFKTSNVLEFPYYEKFDFESTSKEVTYMTGWYTFGSNAAPYVNTCTSVPKYQASVDTTFALCFNGEYACIPNVPLAPASYSYAALPKLEDVEDLSLLQVSFNTIRYFPNKSERFSLIVGVMSDPLDLSTLIPIDTIDVKSKYLFEEFVVSLENYKGEGRFIALVSYFYQSNLFVLDNLKIGYRPKVSKVSFDYKIQSATSLQLFFDKKYAKYEVIASSQPLTEDKLDVATNVVRCEIQDKGVVNGLNPASYVYLYARALSGSDKGEWTTYPKLVRMPAKIDKYPYKVDFEIKTSDATTFYNPMEGIRKSIDRLSNDVLFLSNYSDYPICSNTFYTSSSTPLKSRSPYELRLYSDVSIGVKMAAVMPEMLDVKNTRVTFFAGKHMTSSYYASVFYVGVMSDPSDFSSIYPIDTIVIDDFEYKYLEYELDKYADRGKFFVIYIDPASLQGKSYNEVYIDDVRFTYIPTCKTSDEFNVEYTEEPSKVKLSWNARGASKWNVRLSDYECDYDSLYVEQIFNNYLYDTTITSNSIQFSNLKFPKMRYYYWVQPICGNEVGEWSQVNYFDTKCYERSALPYIENFDNPLYSTASNVAGFTIPCITTQQIYYSGRYFPYLTNSESMSGENALYMAKYADWHPMGTNLYIALPKMMDDINKLQITFKVYANDSKQPLKVGVMTDQLDSANIETVAIVKSKIYREWVEHIVTFDKYTGTGEYIAISTGDSWASRSGIYIDDIEVDYIDKCRRIENVDVLDFDDKSVTLKWVNDANNQWRVLFATEELTSEQLLNPTLNDTIALIDTVGSTRCVIEGLMEHTEYFVYVQSICGVENSRWSNPISFTTACSIVDVAQLGVENFDSYGTGVGKSPSCYTVGNMTGATSSYIPYCSTSYKYSGAASLCFYSTSAKNGAYAIMPRIDISDISLLRLKLWASAGKSNASNEHARSLIVGIITNPTDFSTLVVIDTLNLQNEFQQYEVYFDEYECDYNGEKGKYVIFLSDFEKTNYAYIDDVCLDTIPECVARFDVETIGADSIGLKFLDDSISYQLKYSTEKCDTSLLNMESLPMLMVNDKNFVVRNLDYNTTYYFYARAICGDGYGEWSNFVEAHTICYDNLQLPFTENFDRNKTVGSGALPDCWYTFYNSTSTTYPYVTNSYSASGENSLYMYSAYTGESYLVSQSFDVDDLSKCQVSFKLRPKTKDKKHVLIVGAVSDLGEFEPIDTIEINLSTLDFVKKIVSFESYRGSAKHVAFKLDYDLSGSSVTVYLDDIVVEEIPKCARPDYFKFEGYTDKSIALSFVHKGAESYEVKYGHKGFDCTNAGLVINVKDTFVMVSNLDFDTEYDFYVRAKCNSVDLSDWVYAGSCATIAEAVSVYPYVCTFEDTNENNKWRFAQENQANQWVIGVDTAYVVSDSLNNGNKGLFISKDGGLSAQYEHLTSYSWAYRHIYLGEGVYRISYDWTCHGEQNSDYVRVGMLPISSYFESGSNKVIAQDGSSVSMTYTKANQPLGWIELSAEVQGSSSSVYYRLNMSDTTKVLAEQWSHEDITLIVTPDKVGYYNLIAYWKNDNSGGEYAEKRSAIIDNISVSKDVCNLPISLEVTSLEANSVTLEWQPLGCEISDTYEIVVLSEDLDVDTVHQEQIVQCKQVEATSITLDSLEGNTQYFVYVRSVCTKNNYSIWTEPIAFTTYCNPLPIDTLFDFDDKDNRYFPAYHEGTNVNTSYSLPLCFSALHSDIPFTSSNSTEVYPYLIKNTSALQYSRSGDYALRFYRKYDSKSGAILVLPAIEEDFTDRQLTFWMRSVYHSLSTDNLTVTHIGKNYARKITVGTMTDPADPNSFEPLAVVEYPYASGLLTSSDKASDDPNGYKYWVKCAVPLADAKGKYIAFKNDSYDDKEYNNIYIDDIEITKFSCVTPNGVFVDSIRSTSANIKVAIDNLSEGFELQYSTDKLFIDDIVTKTVKTLPTIIVNLTPSTTYYVRVRSICSNAEKSAWSMPVQFTTAEAIRFTCDFEDYTNGTWVRASAPLLDEKFNNSLLEFTYMSTTSDNGWTLNDGLFDKGKFSSPHISAPLSYTYKYWLFSPFIELPKTTKLSLIFDLALTAKNSKNPVYEADSIYCDDKFAVVISDDFGQTWKRENATIWGVDTDDYVYNNISSTGEQVVIDLAKYAGKSIQIAFYVGSTEAGSQSEIHIDNIHVNTFIEKNIDLTLCNAGYYSYGQHDFYADSLNVGLNSSLIIEKSTTTASDVYNYFDITVLPKLREELDVTICEGDVYQRAGFQALTQAGCYKQKLTSSDGCDSVFVLNLSLTPSMRTVFVDTICSGSSVIWNGKEYDKTGVYIDTLVSNITHCDSIVTFVLNVRNAIRVEQYRNICYGDGYQFGTQYIDKTGTYVETFTFGEGCDSIVTLHATVLPDYRQTINETIIEGERYNDNGFVGLFESGQYILPLKSVDDCDSTITLNLKVIKAEEVAVQNVVVDGLSIVPNPVVAGDNIYLLGYEEIEDDALLVVDMFDLTGQLVFTNQYVDFPIVIKTPSESGVYIVRIIIEDSYIYQEKIIVK